MPSESEQGFDPNKLPFFRREQAYEEYADQDFYQFAVQVAADEVFLMKSDSQIIFANNSACKRLCYQSDELIGKFVWEWDPLFPKQAWPEFWQTFIEAKHLHFETQHCTKQGTIFPVEIHAHLYQRDGENYLLALVTDLTEKKKNEELIYQQANYDQLTGLPNRYLLLDRLKHALLSAERAQHQVGLLFLDLDNFKEINDHHGHHIGDLVLREAANRITLHIRESDTVARLGGDEFVIILENLSPDNMQTIAEKLCNALCQPYKLASSNSEVSTSIGIAIYPDDANNLVDLLIQADKAMYLAKEQGKNRYQFWY